MGDVARSIMDAIGTVESVGGGLEMEIEETPGQNTPANRLKLKQLMKIDELLEKAMKLAERQGL